MKENLSLWISFQKFFLMLLLFLFINGCTEKEDDPVITTKYTVEQTQVSTFELVSLKTVGPIQENYKGTFGNVMIDLVKTSDSTLTFYVPDVTAGQQSLKFESNTFSFNVTKTPDVDPNQVMDTLLKNFDTRMEALKATPLKNIEVLDQMKQYRANLVKSFNESTEEQKKQTALFYEANKSAFVSFANHVNINLNAGVTFRQATNLDQSGCTKTNYLVFYDCTSANLSQAFNHFKESSKECVRMLAYATAMAGRAITLSAFGPVAIGITAVGISFPLSMAIYLAVAEVWPAAVKLFHETGNYLASKWIIKEELYNGVTTSFKYDAMIDLNLNAGFRTLKNTDINITGNISRFINALASLNSFWDKLSSVFGPLPNYQTATNDITLATEDITISNITNNKIQLVSLSGEAVKFKSTSGEDESFEFKVRVSKEGFVREKIVSATLEGKRLYANSIENYIGHLQPYSGPALRCFTLLEVKLKDVDGTLMDGVRVEWRIKSGGGGFYNNETGNLTSTVTSTSRSGHIDDQGIASIQWYPGNDGIQEVEAVTRKADGSLVNGSPVLFKLGEPILGKWNLKSIQQKIDNNEWKALTPTAGDFFELTFTSGDQRYKQVFYGNSSSGTFTIVGHRYSPTSYFFNFSGGNTYLIKSLTATELVFESNYKDQYNRNVQYLYTYIR